MANFPTPGEGVIGIDVAKASVTFYDQLSDTHGTVPNELDALIAAFTLFRDRSLAICEATGGHEDRLLVALHSLGIPVHRADGRRVSAYARSLHPGKTDRIDAQALARYGTERAAQLERHTPAEQAHIRLTALVSRRLACIEARKIERTRAKGPRAWLVADLIEQTLAFLDAQIAELDARIADILAHAPQLAQRRAVLETIPGIGTVTAITLMATMPELGTLTRRQAASLAALAPHPRDSGTSNLPRRTTGGRRHLRPVLFIAALSTIRTKNPLAAFYQRLIANRKPKRLAIVAVMRKIITIANARLAQLT